VKAVPWDVDRRWGTPTGSVIVSGGLYVFLLKTLSWRENTLVGFWGFEPRKALVELAVSFRDWGRETVRLV
jgi:hypothetical protein